MWLTPEVRDHLVYWRNPLETGVVFGSVLVLLVSVKYVSLISVVGNLLLALVTSTVAFRIYKSVLTAVNKSQDKSHPFQVPSRHTGTPHTVLQAHTSLYVFFRGIWTLTLNCRWNES